MILDSVSSNVDYATPARGDTIQFDFTSASIHGAGPVESLGMLLLRLGARLSAPIDYVGYSWGARIVRQLLPSDRDVHVRLADDTLFGFPYGDGYWGTLLDNRAGYAPAVERLLISLKDVPYAFIDCGANFGYMSVLVSSQRYGAKSAIAIEADRDNFEKLQKNALVNGDRFECRKNAIFSKSGQRLQLFGNKHEAYTLAGDGTGNRRGEVTTITLDDVVPWVDAQGGEPVVLKLDIEGVEIAALSSAQRLLERDCLIIYEEHGADPTHELSAYMQRQLNMRLFAEPDKGGGVGEVTDLAFLDGFKTNKRVGYDLFATRSSFWLSKLAL